MELPLNRASKGVIFFEDPADFKANRKLIILRPDNLRKISSEI
jgi:hypothetical protein